MKALLIALTVLMLVVPQALLAQDDSAQDDTGAEKTAEERAEREALREELEQARQKVAQAAREMARIQRQLADEEVENIRIERIKALEGMDEELAGMEERIHREVMRGMRMARPALGVLLGDEGEANKIFGVTPGSGAEKAGIRAGDRLISINGESVDATEPQSLRSAMEGLEPGDSVPVEIERDGERMTLDVTVSSPARDFRVITHNILGPPPGAPDAPDAPRVTREVLVLEDNTSAPAPPRPPLPPRLAGLGRHSDMISNHAGLEPYFGTAEGVVVLRIDADNPLELEDGDVVLTVDGEAVSRPVEIGRALLSRGGETVTLEVMRGGERVTIEAELAESKAVSAHFREFHRGL